jgi:hypothetical protein
MINEWHVSHSTINTITIHFICLSIFIYIYIVRLRKLWRAAAYLIQWHMLQRRTLKVTRLLVEKTENDEDEIFCYGHKESL